MRFVMMAVVVFALACPGCKRNDATRNANGFANAFKQRMDSGQTTRDQEQQYIRACADLCYEVDRATRGKKKADATKAAAQANPDLTPDTKTNSVNLDQ